jgi:transmembrane sensor
MNNLDQLGQRMAGLQDRHMANLRQDTSPPSAAIGEHLLRRVAERRRRRQMTLASATAVLLLGGTLAGLRLWPTRDHATVATIRAQAGQRVAASSLDLALAFDDGSRVVLSSGASLRTEMVGPSSASLELEKGRAAVRVMHTRSTHWTVRAGTYSVLVTGTRFHLDWRPENGALSVIVEEGSVRVTGGLLNEPLDISAGQSLALEQGQPVGAGGLVLPNRTLGAAPPSSTAPEAAPPTFMLSPLDNEAPPMQGHRPAAHHLATPTSPPAVSSSSWRQQAEAGHYRDALAEAERKGFEGICRESSGADLLTLAEAARYAGRAERAEEALKAVRARFGHSDDAALAAYLLGRIAADNHRDHANAAHWFRAYLAERPGGRLDREAEGRLLESLAFMDRDTAREAARAYLQHYPSGPHAAFARNLLGR